MAAYGITVHCKDCGKDHLVFLRIDLSSGPDRKRSVAEVLQGRSLPPQIEAVRRHHAFCCKTGRKFPLDKDEDVFLVPLSQFRHYSISR